MLLELLHRLLLLRELLRRLLLLRELPQLLLLRELLPQLLLLCELLRQLLLRHRQPDPGLDLLFLLLLVAVPRRSRLQPPRVTSYGKGTNFFLERS